MDSVYARYSWRQKSIAALGGEAKASVSCHIGARN